jgi:hypothetical protein
VVLLIPVVIPRIRRRALRLATGWVLGLAGAAAAPYLALLLFFASLGAAMSTDVVTFEAAGSQSVLVTQDQFDGDTVNIYTRQDAISYRLIRSGPEISGWPRVKNQNCVLDTSTAGLQLTCGTKSW